MYSTMPVGIENIKYIYEAIKRCSASVMFNIALYVAINTHKYCALCSNKYTQVLRFM